VESQRGKAVDKMILTFFRGVYFTKRPMKVS
jgi:hypothetical protein